MASLISLFLISSLVFTFTLQISAESDTVTRSECGPESFGKCYNKKEALLLKIIAIGSIFATSMIGVCLPLFSGSVSAFRPDRNLFVLVKAFASGVILATGYMHVMPDSFDDLRSECLPENPWRRFPFTTFVAMVSAVVTLMIDSFVMSYHHRKRCSVRPDTEARDSGKIVHCHVYGDHNGDEEDGSQLLRYRVVAQVLEVGIVVHSVVIGLSLGASQNPCTIRPLVAALCFHQLFEGMGLGGCILQAELSNKVKSIMVFFFSATTPFGIALGIGLSNVYSDNSPTSLIVVGLLNASSAGLLNYMALVDLLAPEFMGPKLQSSMKLQIWAYICVLLGAGGMSVMAIWA